MDMIKSIDHMVLTTSNLEACLYFYADTLGMEHKIVNGQHALHLAIRKSTCTPVPMNFILQHPMLLMAAEDAGFKKAGTGMLIWKKVFPGLSFILR